MPVAGARLARATGREGDGRTPWRRRAAAVQPGRQVVVGRSEMGGGAAGPDRDAGGRCEATAATPAALVLDRARCCHGGPRRTWGVHGRGRQQPERAAGGEGGLRDIDNDAECRALGHGGPNPHSESRTDCHLNPAAGADRGATGRCGSPTDRGSRPSTRHSTGRLLPAEQFGHLLRARRVLPRLRSRANRASRQWRSDRLRVQQRLAVGTGLSAGVDNHCPGCRCLGSQRCPPTLAPHRHRAAAVLSSRARISCALPVIPSPFSRRGSPRPGPRGGRGRRPGRCPRSCRPPAGRRTRPWAGRRAPRPGQELLRRRPGPHPWPAT